MVAEKVEGKINDSDIFHNLYEIVKYVCGLVLHKK